MVWKAQNFSKPIELVLSKKTAIARKNMRLFLSWIDFFSTVLRRSTNKEHIFVSIEDIDESIISLWTDGMPWC